MRLVPLNNTVAFKKLFRDPEILTTFVKDLIGIELNITAENIELEKGFAVPMGAIKIKFDIFAEDPEQRVVVEIQNIVWLTARSTDQLFRKGLITTHYHSVASDGEIIPLYPHRLYFINPSYRDASIPLAVADWLHLASESIYHSDQPRLNLSRPIFEKVTQLIEDDNITPEERAAIMDENDYEHSRQIRFNEGVKEGMEKGRQEGRQEGIAATTRTMLARGFDHALIREITGISEEDLTALCEHR